MVVEQNRYKFRFAICLFSLLFCGCENVSENNKRINIQGIPINQSHEIQLKGICLDTLLFANGKEHFVVAGTFNQNKTIYTYALHYDRHPKEKDAQLIYLIPPFEQLNDADCELKLYENKCEITLTKDRHRLFLKDQFIEER